MDRFIEFYAQCTIVILLFIKYFQTDTKIQSVLVVIAINCAMNISLCFFKIFSFFNFNQCLIEKMYT